MVLQELVDLLRSYNDLIRPSFYIVFVCGVVLTFAFSHRKPIKKTYLVGFFAVLLVVTLVGSPLPPIVDMHKFSTPADEERTIHQIRVVDESGTELRYDTRAISPVMGSRTSILGSDMANQYNDSERQEMTAFLLTSASEYRTEVEANDSTFVRALGPPRYVDEPAWTASELDDVGQFVEIRIYRVIFTVTDDNREIDNYDEQLMLAVDTEGNVTEHGEA